MTGLPGVWIARDCDGRAGDLSVLTRVVWWSTIVSRICRTSVHQFHCECASVSLFWHFRGFSTRDVENASLEILFFCFQLCDYPFDFWCLCLALFCLFFNPLFPTVELRVYCTSICSLSAHPTVSCRASIHLWLRWERMALKCWLVGTVSQRLVILVISRTLVLPNINNYCFEFMRQSCCLWISVELKEQVGTFHFSYI